MGEHEGRGLLRLGARTVDEPGDDRHPSLLSDGESPGLSLQEHHLVLADELGWERDPVDLDPQSGDGRAIRSRCGRPPAESSAVALSFPENGPAAGPDGTARSGARWSRSPRMPAGRTMRPKVSGRSGARKSSIVTVTASLFLSALRSGGFDRGRTTHQMAWCHRKMPPIAPHA
jgi:hypothetical protein